MTRVRRRLTCGLLITVTAAALTACGSSGSSTGATATATTKSAASPGPTSYTGVQKDLPPGFRAPTRKSGGPLTIGYLQIYGALPVLAAEQKGAEDQARRLGARFIAKDAQLNPQTQVSQFNQMLAQHLDAIVVYPVVPQSLRPSLARAKAAGIPVVSTNARPDVTQALPAGYTADVEQTLDHEAYSMAKEMAAAQPGAKFGIIGLALPVQALKYLAAQQRHWGERFGLKFVGEVDAKQDTPTAYGPAVSELLSKAPGIQQVFTYNDAVALTASTVARSSGKPDMKIAGGSGAEQPMLEAIKAGRIQMAYQMPWEQTGAQMVMGAYNAATRQNLPLPETVGLRGGVITKQNVAQSQPTR